MYYIENGFPEIFKNRGEDRKVKITIDLHDWRHCIVLIITIGVILFTPWLNIGISIVYSLFIIYQIYKYYRK